MSYHTTAITVKGKGYPMTLGVIMNGGTITVSMEMSGVGVGTSADHLLEEDGIWTFYPGVSLFTITPAGGAVFEITE
jgi:hypothetical protein